MTDYPKHYFEDEVIDGFYVSGMMKRAWAAQLEVLDEIDKVCKKLNIRWFIDGGTLIGAVRHHGFIPWDDDMDICMLRADYDKFREYAVCLLPDSYRMTNSDDDKVHFGRVLNSTEFRFDDAFLTKYYGCFFPVGVDVFPVDYLFEDEEIENSRCEIIDALLNFTVMDIDSDYTKEEFSRLIGNLENMLEKEYDRDKNIKQLVYEILDDVCSLASKDNAKWLAEIVFYYNSRKKKYPVECFDEIKLLDFENRLLPAPAGYDAVLTNYYGDYMAPVIGGGEHEYPFFDKLEKDLIGRIDNYSFKYSFSEKDLCKTVQNNSIKDLANDTKTNNEIVHAAYSKLCKEGKYAEAVNMLSLWVKSLKAIANTIRKNCNEENEIIQRIEFLLGSLESLLNELCESKYESERMIDAGCVFDDITDVFVNRILEKKEIVFLVYRADYWSKIADIYESFELSREYTVYVMPVPYYSKSALGGYVECFYEPDDFPDEVHVIDYKQYNLEFCHPEIILTQQPFDECNYTMGIECAYYSSVIKNYTDCLMYVSPYNMDEFDKSDKKQWKTMDYFCTVPGVVHADCVVVQSEKMRKLYIDKLSEFAGEDTRSVWENKICININDML